MSDKKPKATKKSAKKTSSKASEKKSETDVWPLESERLAVEDPLLECLVILAKENGRRTSVAALTAGLPLSKQGFASPSLFVRAAERAQMSARLLRRPLKEIIKSPNLPCILVLHANQSCILKSVSTKGVDLIFPEAPEKIITIPFADLETLYKGYAFFVTGHVRVDERTGPAVMETEKDWFWGVIKRHKNIYVQVFFAALMINLFALVSPIFVMNVYDRVLPNQAFDTLSVLAIGAVIAMVFDFILKNLRAHFLDAAGRKSDVKISGLIFERIQGMKMSARPPSTGVLADNMREFESIRDFFTSATLTTIVDLPFTLLFIFLIWVIGGPLAIIPCVMTFVIFFVGYFLQKPLAKCVNEHANEGAYKTSILIETLNGLETIKIQAAEGHNQRKWEEIIEQSSLTAVKARHIAAVGSSFTGLSASIASIIVVVYGAHLVGAGDLTTGALIACVILSGRVVAPLAQLSGLLTKFNQSRSALLRLDNLMKSPVEREINQSFISKPVLEGDIVFRDVVFKYPGQEHSVLKKVRMGLRPGDRVAVIGSVGSGKTTLQRLLMNLYQPDEGSIEIDGLDVRQIEPGDLRRNIGVAQQDAYLFFGSVRDNIIMGHESVSEEAVLRAAKLAGISQFMKDSPLGLDTQVGERGAMLSGGQRQAVAVARALLYDPPILILDEPTASIDPKSEKELLERLAIICQNKTVLLITHRTPLLALSNKIALMDKGEIVDYGARDDILKKLEAREYMPAGR